MSSLQFQVYFSVFAMLKRHYREEGIQMLIYAVQLLYWTSSKLKYKSLDLLVFPYVH